MITGAIYGVPELVVKLGNTGSFMQREVKTAVERLTLQLLAKVKLKLSDDVLHVKTGRLRRSITSTVAESAKGVYGKVGTNVAYARFHEYGFTGEEAVREHLRTIKTAFGKSIKNGPVTFTVRAHTRHIDYPAHSFLRSSLADMQGQIESELRAITDKVKL